MTFNTVEFLAFFGLFIVLYYLLPVKVRNPLLLLGSYLFYAYYSPILVTFLAAVTLVNYGGALLIERFERGSRGRRTVLAAGLVLDIGVLAFYKYFNFFSGILHQIGGRGGSPVTLKLLVPLGISFIIFSVASYLVDVYRGTIGAERRIWRFALYVAFFPKVVQGPIERAEHFLPQLDEEHRFDSEKYRTGMLMFLFGLFMKMVVADRAAIIVDTVYANLDGHTGASVLLAAMMFSLQIYLDFAGYSLMAIGGARILGFQLKRNFQQPYLASTPAVFWRRWHISLTTWLLDYLYIPLGGSRCSALRRHFNTLVTFGLSGLWHGANWGFVIWGLANGAVVAVEGDIRKLGKKKGGDRAEKKASPVRSVLLGILSFFILTATWVFFRAQTLAVSLHVFKRIFTSFLPRTTLKAIGAQLALGKTGMLYGLNVSSGYPILLMGLLIVAAVDIAMQKVDLPQRLAAEKLTWLRWIVYILLICAVVVFGVYGYGYEAASFIYADF